MQMYNIIITLMMVFQNLIVSLTLSGHNGRTSVCVAQV